MWTARTTIQCYCVPVLLTALATWGRVSLDPYVSHRSPFGLFFLSVLATALISGFWPAIAALLLGIVAAAIWVIPPDHSPWIDDSGDLYSLLVYTATTSIAIGFYGYANHQFRQAHEATTINHRLIEDLKLQDRRKDEFLATLAHELRNPLAPIRSGLESLERLINKTRAQGFAEASTEARSEDGVASPGREPAQAMPKSGAFCLQQSEAICGAMQRQLTQLVRIVDDLLDVYRITRDQVPVVLRPMDLRSVVRTSIEATRIDLETRGHELCIVIPDEPVPVRGDVTRLVQVLTNLITNAAKYTPPSGRVEVFLDTEQTDAVLRVRDNGIGIIPEDRTRIFEAFTQGATPRTRDVGGLGLGLTLARRLTRLHHGTIGAESEGHGRGSCFEVRLPLCDGAELNGPVPESGGYASVVGLTGEALAASMPVVRRAPEDLTLQTSTSDASERRSLAPSDPPSGVVSPAVETVPESDADTSATRGTALASPTTTSAIQAAEEPQAASAPQADPLLQTNSAPQTLAMSAAPAKTVPCPTTAPRAAASKPRSPGQATAVPVAPDRTDADSPLPTVAQDGDRLGPIPPGEPRPIRVLIVDDNQDAAEMLAAVLSFDQIDTQVATNGSLGLDLARQFEPDVVLLDLGMPGMSGYEVAKRLRLQRGGRERRLIALTGWGSDADRKRSREAGCDDHLVKPVDIQVLLQAIRQTAPVGAVS